MTNKEAKEKLYMEWQKFLEDNIDYAGISEAYKMAIKALEQKPCEDSISRQAVLSDKYIVYDMADNKDKEVVDVEFIKSLPPVQPKVVPIAEIRFDDDKLHEIVDEAVKNIEIKYEWIPVSERLPNNHEYIENNGLFNVSDGNRSYSEYFDIYDTKRFGEPTMSGFRVDYAVTAWMPLPKSYKPQESEEV